MSANVGIFSLHWENIDPRVPEYQKKVFNHLGLPIFQHRIDGLDHGDWMDWVLNYYEPIDTIIFFDVDCIPTDRSKTLKSVELATSGTLVGNEQASNHLDSSRLFAAPSFLCVNRRLWRQLGKPSCKAHYDGDVAQMLTDTWLYHKLPVEFIPAVDCETPMWDLPERPQSYGIGTNYGDQNYHLFQVSYDRNVDLFVRKAEEILTR